MEKQDFFEFGTIMKARGLKGEIQIYFDGKKAANFEGLDELYIEVNKKLVPFQILKSQFQKNVAFVYLEDIETLEQASTLIKKRVFLPNDRLEDVQPDFDPKGLEGYEIIGTKLGSIGTIKEVLEFPNQLIASLIYQNCEVLIPLNDNTILEVIESTKSIKMEIPDGLIDIYLDPNKDIKTEED